MMIPGWARGVTACLLVSSAARTSGRRARVTLIHENAMCEAKACLQLGRRPILYPDLSVGSAFVTFRCAECDFLHDMSTILALHGVLIYRSCIAIQFFLAMG